MPNPATVPAWRSPTAWALLLVTFGVAVGFDLWTKDWAFRTVAGLFFALLFLLRGFGIAAGTHFSYDLLVGLV